MSNDRKMESAGCYLVASLAALAMAIVFGSVAVGMLFGAWAGCAAFAAANVVCSIMWLLFAAKVIKTDSKAEKTESEVS